MLTPLERHPLEDSPELLKVTEERVQKVLEKFNPNKASHAWQKCMQNRQYAICISSGYSSQNIQYWLPR